MQAIIIFFLTQAGKTIDILDSERVTIFVLFVFLY